MPTATHDRGISQKRSSRSFGKGAAASCNKVHQSLLKVEYSLTRLGRTLLSRYTRWSLVGKALGRVAGKSRRAQAECEGL